MRFEGGGVVVCGERDDVCTLLVVLRLWVVREGLRFPGEDGA